MRTSFYKGIVLGAAVSMLVLVASTAVAGTGVGGIFNLGQTNTVDATSRLNGTATNSMLDVSNAGTGANSNGIVGRSASPLAPALAGTNSGGGSGLKGTSSSGTGLYGQSTSGLGARLITGGALPALKATNTGSGPAAAFEAGGTAPPFTVNSSTLVGNLNADLLGGLHASDFLRKGVDETAAVNSAGGVLSVTNTGTSNGVQGRTADINSGGVYGENTSGEGYGIGGRAGQGGIGVYGDNTGTGWAGYFQGNVHIDALDLGGALNCTECVHTGDVAGGYIQGGGKAAGQAVAIGPGAHYFLGPALTGFLRLSYECPATLTDNGTLHVYNDSGSPANVFVESGYPNPNYFVMPASGPGQELTFPASATGDSWHIQAQGALGVLTIEAASVHRASDCHAQAQALLTG